MTYHNKKKQEVLQELNVQESTGLSSSEVKKAPGAIWRESIACKEIKE